MAAASVDQQDSALVERYRAGSPRSREQFDRDCKSMPGGVKGVYFYPPYPLTMVRGEGCYLDDADGRRFVDCVSHHTALILGHNHPAVMDAVHRQLEHGIVLSAPTGGEMGLAEEICGRVPSIEGLRFCCSGTEATLHAIRLARGFTGRPKIAKFEGGYHGSHDVVEISVAPPLDRVGPETGPHSVPTAGGISPHAAEEVVVLPYDDEESVERLIADNRDELACLICDAKTGILETRREFVKAVRADGSWKALPMIALSSYATQADVERGMEYGFDDYVGKFNRDAIFEALRRTLTAQENAAQSDGGEA